MEGDDPQEEEQEECPVCKKGAPMWMSTFADMATLLMAFFCTNFILLRNQAAQV